MHPFIQKSGLLTAKHKKEPMVRCETGVVNRGELAFTVNFLQANEQRVRGMGGRGIRSAGPG